MLWLALALTAAPVATAAKDKTQSDSPPPQMQKLLENCDAHKFETIVEVTLGGQVKHSRVKLCGTEGQSDAEWIKTLEDAVAKTSASLEMPPAVRDQIVAALKTEIVRLKGGGAAAVLGSLPPPRTTTKRSVLDGLAVLPPLPEAKGAAVDAVLPPPRMIAPSTRPPEYATLPPLPTAPSAPTRVLVAAISGSLPQLPKPRMSFSCYTPGESEDGPCTGFTRDTLLTVRADEDLPSGTSVRFVRNGDARADVELAQLRKGKTQRFPVPPEVCSHISGATLELRIVRSLPAAGPSGEEVGKDGPYDLRC